MTVLAQSCTNLPYKFYKLHICLALILLTICGRVLSSTISSSTLSKMVNKQTSLYPVKTKVIDYLSQFSWG